MATKIIIAAHKQYRMPEDELYLPVQVGASCNKDENGKPVDLGFARDDTGENISEKNPHFCELTGLYWAWKNLEADHLGLSHYRRYFGSPNPKKTKDLYENVLTGKEAEELFRTYRVLVPKKRNYYIETLYSHYAHTHYAEHLDETRNIIAEVCPEYLGAFDTVMAHRYGHMFNMCVMERDLMDNYCSWVFDILFRLEERLKGEEAELSFYQGRFYGRVSEIIFNVWLQYQLENGVLKESDICELPCLYTEKVNWLKKGTAFLSAKFLHKRYENSF
ncbi:MAG: DUF4422 domain-containing protein [Clostridia bacterium]|nr:DUF4422 domain-containing protein [Clostridia bacterium]